MRYKTTKRLNYRTWDHLHFEWKPCENKKDWTQESVDERFVSNGTNGLNFVAGDPKESKKSSEWYDIHDAFDHDVYFRHNWKKRRLHLLHAKIDKCDYSTTIVVTREAFSQGVQPNGRFIQGLLDTPNVVNVRFFDQHLPEYRIILYCKTEKALMYCKLEFKHRLGKYKFLHNESPSYREISPSSKFAVPRIIGHEEGNIKKMEALDGIDFVRFDKKKSVFCIGGTTLDAVERVKAILRAQMWNKSCGNSYKQVAKKNSRKVAACRGIKFYPYSSPSFKEKMKLKFVIEKETMKPLTGQPQSKKAMSKKQIKNNKNSVDKNKGKNVKTSENKKNTETSAKKSAAKKVKNNAKKKKNKGYIAPAGKVLPAQSSTQQNMTEPMSDHRQQNGFVRVHQQLPRNVMQPLIHQISNRYTYPGGYGYPGGYVNPGGYVYPGGKIWRPMVQTELPPNWNHQVGPVMVLNPGANGFTPQSPILSGETGSHV